MGSGLLDSAFKSIKQVRQGLAAEAVRITKENDNILIDLNTDQLFQGLDSKGKELGEYSPFTIMIKKAKGQPYDRVTLKDSGEFYEGFFIEVNKAIWTISSRDQKTDKLIKEWGKDIFGNTKQDEKDFNLDYVLEGLIEWMLSKIEV